MKARRVAFCFSGQTRTWKYCYPMWKKLMDEFDIEPDVFIHTWDHNTNQQRLNTWPDDFQNCDMVDDMADYLSTLNPKKYKIDTISVGKSCIKSTTDKILKYSPDLQPHQTVGWMAPQFYSMMYASFLKQQYEIENSFQYDLVFKFRNDLVLTEHHINRIMTSNIIPDVLDDQTMYTVHSGSSEVAIAGFARVGDVFFIAPSRVYDMICNFYRMIPYIFSMAFDCRGYPPEFYIAYYIKSLHLSFIDMSLDMTIARTPSYEKNLKNKGLNILDCDLIIHEKPENSNKPII